MGSQSKENQVCILERSRGRVVDFFFFLRLSLMLNLRSFEPDRYFNLLL